MWFPQYVPCFDHTPVEDSVLITSPVQGFEDAKETITVRTPLSHWIGSKRCVSAILYGNLERPPPPQAATGGTRSKLETSGPWCVARASFHLTRSIGASSPENHIFSFHQVPPLCPRLSRTPLRYPLFRYELGAVPTGILDLGPCFPTRLFLSECEYHKLRPAKSGLL